MIQKFYDSDPMRINPDNQNANLLAVNLSDDLWTQEGKYKASIGKLIRFEADSFFTDSYELIVIEGKGLAAKETKLVENKDFFLGDEDVELGSPYTTSLGVKLQDTLNVRKAQKGRLVLRGWVGRQTLKARDLNQILTKLSSGSETTIAKSSLTPQPSPPSQIDNLSTWENFYIVGFDKISQRQKKISFDELRKRMEGPKFTDKEVSGWLSEGFSWLEIGVFYLQHKNLKQDRWEYFSCGFIHKDHTDNIINFIKTPEGYKMTGIALCDGEQLPDGMSSHNLSDRFIRSYSMNIHHDGKKVTPYQYQEDATQHWHFGFSVGTDYNSGNRGWGGAQTAPGPGMWDGKGDWYPVWHMGSVSVNNALAVRTSDETRPKSIYIPFFQVIHKLDWQNISYHQPMRISH